MGTKKNDSVTTLTVFLSKEEARRFRQHKERKAHAASVEYAEHGRADTAELVVEA